MASGELLPDRLLLDVLKRPLAELRDAGAGFVLDGFPRTVAQAAALDEMLSPDFIDVVVQLVVDPKVLATRLAARGRDDDNAAAIEHRLRGFERETRPMIERYRCSGRLVVLDGHQPVEDVYAQIEEELTGGVIDVRATRSAAPRAAALRSRRACASRPRWRLSSSPWMRLRGSAGPSSSAGIPPNASANGPTNGIGPADPHVDGVDAEPGAQRPLRRRRTPGPSGSHCHAGTDSSAMNSNSRPNGTRRSRCAAQRRDDPVGILVRRRGGC